MFNRPNVELVTTPIERITPTGLVASDGTERGIVPAFEIRGRGGLEIGDYWTQNRCRAFQGITVPNLPNDCRIFGPCSAASASWFGLIDTQVRHFSRSLAAARRRGAECIEVKQISFDEDFEHVLPRRRNQLLFFGNCAQSNSYYLDRNGAAPLLRPATQLGRWIRRHWVSMNHYHFTRGPAS